MTSENIEKLLSLARRDDLALTEEERVIIRQAGLELKRDLIRVLAAHRRIDYGV